MGLYPNGITIILLAVLHIGLLIWVSLKISKSKISAFEKASWLLVCLTLPLLGVGIYSAYEKKYLTKAELRDITFAIILLGFIFSFRLWGSTKFSVNQGLNNWLRMCGLAFITLFVHILAQKRLAQKFDSMARFRIWKVAATFAIIIAFVTNGWFIWAAIGCVAVESWIFLRPGKKKGLQALGAYETAKIVSAGPFASIGLAVLAKLLSKYFAKELFSQLMIMNLWFAAFSIIPFMMLRFISAAWFSKLTSKKNYEKRGIYILLKFVASKTKGYLSEGEHIFFGSKLLWVFTSVFVISSCVLLLLFQPLFSILIAAILAAIAFVIWHQKFELLAIK